MQSSHFKSRILVLTGLLLLLPTTGQAQAPNTQQMNMFLSQMQSAMQQQGGYQGGQLVDPKTQQYLQQIQMTLANTNGQLQALPTNMQQFLQQLQALVTANPAQAQKLPPTIQTLLQSLPQQSLAPQPPSSSPQPLQASVQPADQSGAQAYMTSSLQALHHQIHQSIPHESARKFASTRQKFPATYAIFLGLGMQKQHQMLQQNGDNEAYFDMVEKEIIADLHTLARQNGNKNPRDGSQLTGATMEKDYFAARKGYWNDTMEKYGIHMDRVTMQYIF